MMSRQQERGLSRDDGLTVLEMTIVLAILSAISTIVFTLFNGFNRDVEVESALAAVEREHRPVLREMVIQIRQAIPPDSDRATRPIEKLDWRTLVIFSERAPIPAAGPFVPVKHTYDAINCTNGANGGVCDIRLTLQEPDDVNASPDFTYGAQPADSRVILEKVALSAADPLFYGVDYVGSPLARSVVGSCDVPNGTACQFPLVGINLRSVPDLDVFPLPNLEVREEVRMRNAE